MRVGLAATFLIFSGAACASGSTIADACLRAVEIDTQAISVTAYDIEDFAELVPPRVNMRVAYSVMTEPDAVAKLLGAKPEPYEREIAVRCQFDNAIVPYGLAGISCPGLECHVSDMRLAELRTLLEREGF